VPHHAAAQFADDGLPGLGVFRDPVVIHQVESQAAAEVVDVMTFAAIGFDERPLRIGFCIELGLRWQCRGRRCACSLLRRIVAAAGNQHQQKAERARGTNTGRRRSRVRGLRINHGGS
jgi:hypothetical protein